MKSIVLYFYPNNPNQSRLLADQPLWVGDKIIGYVRTELHEHGRIYALAAAKPKANETVLNAVELT